MCLRLTFEVAVEVDLRVNYFYRKVWVVSNRLEFGCHYDSSRPQNKPHDQQRSRNTESIRYLREIK